MNLHNKKFVALENSENGEVGAGTVFHYRQQKDIVWATYEGGSIKFGTLSGSIEHNQLTFYYQHQDLQGIFKTGKCQTTVAWKADKIQLQESWQWTCGDYSKGTSILIEQ